MNKVPTLREIATSLVANHKGLLAMDESTPTCNGRFARLGIPLTEEARRSYREMLITTPGLGSSISGVILYDETVHQSTKDGVSFMTVLAEAGIIPGIKVDTGAKALAAHPGEKVTEGLDGLRERLAKYAALGARFAKWRAVITIGEGRPTAGAIATNAQALARYAALCQEAGLVPVVEPEVLMEGSHSLEHCAVVTERTLHAVFHELVEQRVGLEELLLKVNMVLAGLDCTTQPPVDEVAEATVKCLRRAVPAAVPGIVFLSGGQSAEDATARLHALWRGHDQNVAAAQRALAHRARCNRAACRGNYQPEMENLAA
jgi:fructose-bisphosphate aldolase class I